MNIEQAITPGIKPAVCENDSVPLTPLQSDALMTAISVKMAGDDAPLKIDHLLVKILNKRIEVLGLPISFSVSGTLAAIILARNPGQMMVLLIDALERFPGARITSSEVVAMYPFGFYSDEALEIRMDLIKDTAARAAAEGKPRTEYWDWVY